MHGEGPGERGDQRQQAGDDDDGRSAAGAPSPVAAPLIALSALAAS